MAHEIKTIKERLDKVAANRHRFGLQTIDSDNRVELRSRSFLQDFVDYGSVCEFKVHDLVHDLAQYVARDEFQLIESNIQNISENVLHLSFIKNDLLDQIPIPRDLRLRTMLFPLEANNDVFFNNLVSRCKYLRVLQINHSRYERLHCSISKLKHLRCLNLEYNQKLKRLSDGIGNLISLRQLHITSKQSNFPDKEIAKLNSLEVLSFISCDNLESLFEGIQLPRLKYLEICSCGNLKSVPLYVVPNLETLSIDDCGKLDLSMGLGNQIPKLRPRAF